MKLRLLKEELKADAELIRKTRKEHKELQRSGDSEGYVYRLSRLKHDIRHKHIAYCLLRGTPLERIERTNYKAGPPSMRIIEEIMALEVQREDVRSDEA